MTKLAVLAILITSTMATVGACTGKNQAPNEAATEEKVAQVAQAFTESASATLPFAVPLSTQYKDVRADSVERDGGAMDLRPDGGESRDGGGGPDRPRNPTERELDKTAENAVGAQQGVVVDPACVSYRWAGLSLSVTFARCVLTATGETIDGTATFAATLAPVGLSVAMVKLTIGPNAFDGNVAVSFSGMPIKTTVSSNLSATLDGAATTLNLKQVSLEVDASGLLTSGGLEVTSTGVNADVTFSAVRIETGNCLPTVGTLTIPAYAATVTFLPTTPADGIVLVKIGALPPQSRAIFAPCK